MEITRKKIILILFLLGFLLQANGQELINEKFYSKSVEETIDLKIWLPKDYLSEKSYPVIYEFVYDHSGYIAATLNHLYECPKAIVVHASFYPGTSYEEPTLSAKGEKYYQFVKDELLPHIERKYKTLHKTATGLSQGADYVNYILRTNPELFDAYMIYAIESPNYQADFTAYTDKLKEQKDYFIAIANDVERRVQFANDLYTNLEDNAKVNVLKREYENAAHSYGMLYGLADGLLFTYKDYVAYRDKAAGESFSQYFSNVVHEIEQRFGTVQYNGFLITLFDQLTKESPKAEIQAVLEKLYADKVNISDLDLFNLGYMLSEELEHYDLSEATFLESIARGKKLPAKERRMKLSDTYSWLSRVYYQQKAHDKIYSSLQDGYEVTKSKYLLRRYAAYSFHIGEEEQVKKGIAALDRLVALPKSEDAFNNPEQPKDAIYTLYAKGYWKLKKEKESRKYLEKALAINPNNESALAFQKSIQ